MTTPPTDGELKDWIDNLTFSGPPENILHHQFLRTAEALLAERAEVKRLRTANPVRWLGENN